MEDDFIFFSRDSFFNAIVTVYMDGTESEYESQIESDIQMI